MDQASALTTKKNRRDVEGSFSRLRLRTTARLLLGWRDSMLTTRSLAIGVFFLATLAPAVGCSSVPSITFDGGTDDVTEQQGTEPDACAGKPAGAPATCCGTHWCYGEQCDCGECAAKCGEANQVCCSKKTGPPAGRITCKPAGEGC